MKKTEIKKDFEEIIKKDDKKVNILVMGCSGCGKSTLINAILEEDKASTGSGTSITREISMYENDTVPFRMIDTVGFEFNIWKQIKIKHDLEQWGKKAIKEKKTEHLIHAVWFCIDGTVKRVPKEILDYLHDISRMWKNIPILVVFTKSYSQSEIEENLTMFRVALDGYKKKKDLNIKDVVAVVAKPYPIDDTHIVPAFGLDTLIEKTNAIAPEAKEIVTTSIKKIDLQMKKNMAYGILSVSTVSACVVGAVPIPIPDSTILVPLQTTMLKSIASTFNIKDKSLEKDIINAILNAGATTIVAKSILNSLKANPALNIGADILNAAVAGIITYVSGQIEVTIFENVYLGTLDLDKIDISETILKMFKDKMPDVLEMLEKNILQEDGKITIEKLQNIFFSLFKKQ